MTYHIRHIASRARIAAAATALAIASTGALLQGCKTDTLLEAVDPDLIVPNTLENREGALAVYYGALTRLRTATVSTSDLQEPEFLFSGLLADEWSTSSTFIQNDEVDQRSISLDNASVRNQFRQLARARTASNQAIILLTKYTTPVDKVKIGEMYFTRGFAELQLASDFCNGIPLSEAAGDVVTLGQPLPVAEVFNRAIASFDSALANVPGTSAAEVDIARATRVAKARALLGVNKVAEAGALVTPALVPTSYSYDVTHSVTGASNAIWGQGSSSRRYTVGDSLEGNARNLLVKNAIPFFSAKDPRLPVTYTIASNGKDTTKSQDGFTFSRTTTLYGQLTSVPLASGLDARLIEAEGRLQAGDYTGMIAILNALRAAPPKLGDVQPSGLAPLAAPASKAAAEDVYFREKAFWTFARGQRLGDLRRLIRFYGRTPENTFPTGTHYRGGNYGPDVNLPVPTDELTNPNFKGCLDRKA
jgi:hypothetical protein